MLALTLGAMVSPSASCHCPPLCSAGSSPWLATASAEWRTCSPCDTCASWTCPTTESRCWTQVGGRNGSGRGLGLPERCLGYQGNASRPLIQALPEPLTLRSQPEPQQSHPGAGLPVMLGRDTRGARWPGLSCPFCWQTPGVCFHLVSCFSSTFQAAPSRLGVFNLEQSCSSPDNPSCIFQPAPPVGDFWQKRKGQG